jgi:cytochrome P450
MGDRHADTNIGATTASASPSPDEFSLFDPEVQSDPYAFYRAMHQKCPVYRVPEKGFYIVSRYDDLDRVLRDPETFSNVLDRTATLQGENAKIHQNILRERGWEHVSTLQRSDPPQHARYRKIIDRALNATQVRELQPRLQKVANSLIDQFIDNGECDFIDQFAVPFPGIIVAELIGLDAKDYRRFKRWADNMLAYGTRLMSPDELREAAEIELEMQHFVAAVLEDRRENPRDDLMSGLVTAYEGVEPLTMHELQNVMHQLISGGYETTASALSHGLWQMIRFPDVVAELRADRSLMRNFINESLRWESPVQSLYRMTTRDVELSGTLIPKGTLCNVRFAAANRDEAEFPNADTFDIHRENGALHLGFGAPPHFCPGAVLARAELSTAFNIFLDRMANFQLARPLPYPVHRPSVGNIPMKEFWLKFQKL